MAPGLKITAGTGLHKGDRDYQQDQLGVFQHPHSKQCLLAVIADGMGGRSGGRKASDQVLLTAHQLFARFSPETDSPHTLLAQIVDDAHMVIRLTAVTAEQEPHSTLAAFLLMPNGACLWAHVGDSRIYHYQRHRLVKRTVDHSYVQSLVDKGVLSPEQANSHPQSNVLMACLGTETPPPFSTHTVDAVQAGDTLMACSDGVWHYLSETEIGLILDESTPKEGCEALIGAARERAMGHGDNLSVVVVKFEQRA
jgi:serine/threonine protein phosphatase PrpC